MDKVRHLPSEMWRGDAPSRPSLVPTTSSFSSSKSWTPSWLESGAGEQDMDTPPPVPWPWTPPPRTARWCAWWCPWWWPWWPTWWCPCRPVLPTPTPPPLDEWWWWCLCDEGSSWCRWDAANMACLLNRIKPISWGSNFVNALKLFVYVGVSVCSRVCRSWDDRRFFVLLFLLFYGLPVACLNFSTYDQLYLSFPTPNYHNDVLVFLSPFSPSHSVSNCSLEGSKVPTTSPQKKKQKITIKTRKKKLTDENCQIDSRLCVCVCVCLYNEVASASCWNLIWPLSLSLYIYIYLCVSFSRLIRRTHTVKMWTSARGF